LEFARQAARRLRGIPSVSGLRPAVPRYVSFKLGKAIDSEGKGPNTVRGATSASWGSDHWNQLLDEAIEASDSESAFVMDEHGLVIGVRGRVDAETAELLGAHITVTFQQADRMRLHEGGVTTICVDLAHSWLNGLKCRLDGGGFLVLGLLAGRPIQDETKDLVAQLVVRAAHVLRGEE